MMAEIQENVVLYDWLTFTSKKHDPWQLVEILGLGHCQWINRVGRYSYKEGIYFGHIGIYYDGQEDMGVCVEMSGQGCREFESYSEMSGKWDDLFRFILQNDLRVTRLDVAFDDHTGLLNINRIEEDAKRGLWISKFKKCKIEQEFENGSEWMSKSLRFGSKQSRALIRIYDKAVERGYTDGRHWVRCEMVLKNERAMAFLDYKREIMDKQGNIRLEDVSIGEKFCGVLRYYLRFIVPSETDSNKRRWETADYWDEFCCQVEKIRLLSVPGEEYNVEALKRSTVNMWGNAFACALEIFGEKDFIDMIYTRTCKPNVKYELLIRKHNAHLEELRQEAEEKMQFEPYMVEVRPGVFQPVDYEEQKRELIARNRKRYEEQEKDWVFQAEIAPHLGGRLGGAFA